MSLNEIGVPSGAGDGLTGNDSAGDIDGMGGLRFWLSGSDFKLRFTFPAFALWLTINDMMAALEQLIGALSFSCKVSRTTLLSNLSRVRLSSLVWDVVFERPSFFKLSALTFLISLRQSLLIHHPFINIVSFDGPFS